MKDTKKSDTTPPVATSSLTPPVARTARTARVKALEENSLILEMTDTGELITWPLSALPQPFALDSDLVLELKALIPENDAQDISPTPISLTPSTSKNSTSKSTSSLLSSSHEAETEESSRRKLLEQMIN